MIVVLKKGPAVVPTIAQLAKSKTLWFAAVLASLSTAQGYFGIFALDHDTQMYVGIGASVAVAALRFLTTDALLEK